MMLLQFRNTLGPIGGKRKLDSLETANCFVTHPLCKTCQFHEEYGYEEEGNRTVSYQPIENYGIIGNMRTIALVGMNGSIDWYCYPHFDSPSVFGAILDDKKGGRFQLSAASDGVRHK